MNGQAFLGQGKRRKMTEMGGCADNSLSFCVLPNMYSILNTEMGSHAKVSLGRRAVI